jgi:L-fuconolactonase
MRIDAHQHFWKFDAVRDSWINEKMKLIQKDFLPTDLLPVLKANGIDGSITVQSDQSESENSFQLQNADQYDFIKGIVGWVDLRSKDIEDRLKYYSSFKKLKGFRHILQGETDRSLMLKPDFKNGIRCLKQFDFTYDILVLPDQLKYVEAFVSEFPEQKFVIDHLAKPYIKFKKIEEWKSDMKVIAKHENVCCKISGMVTEADWKNWREKDFTPYIDVIVEAFGIRRIMYGSDWPVCLVASTYEKMIAIVNGYFSSFSKDEQGLFFGANATAFYQLNI